MGISVVIPLYNKEKHIQRAIKSVINQTYIDFELLVVNDGSTDDSLNKAKKIEDTRIKFIDQTNNGVSAARNTGILNSKNDIIAFLDADDEWKPNFLETISNLFHKYPDAGAFATALELVNVEKGKQVSGLNGLLSNGWEGIIDDYFKYAIKSPMLSSSSTAISRKVFDKVGYFTVGMSRGEDLQMWAKIALNFKIAYSNTVCSRYYEDAENRASNKSGVSLNSFTSQSEEFYEKNKNKQFATPFFLEYMIRLFQTKAKYLIQSNKSKQARKLLLKYKNTKYFRARFIVLYVLTFVDFRIINKILN